ncbi:HWE histidine kinase domain-containing protein [uncultured Phenylobacterium sp.]|uniref:sensor histidine kinase n=1 Tax=uncultured Phenylobacterium sp. TaxID=349273 RepID=UPI0025E05D82|nr:HWE histidine kinase domain-containing protein [uncultured Phenylobacterium sp.]
MATLILEHAREYAILTLDLAGTITSWSAGAERITGYTSDEAVGMDFAVIFTAADRSAGQPRFELEQAWREGRAEDSRWHLRKDGERFWANGVTMSLRDAGVEGLIKVIRDETSGRLADEQRVLLLNELNHRINNTLATVQSLVEQTLRAAEVDRSVRDDLTARLMALSDAHNALVAENWAGADLHAIVTRALSPYEQPGRGRFTVDGPPVRLSPPQAVSMSLVLHELATNAVKYGALRTLSGSVAVDWNQHVDSQGGRHLTLLWAEEGGPVVSAPTRRGFGSRLIARSFAEDSGGRARIDFAAGGVRCVIELTLSTEAELPMLDVVEAIRAGEPDV